MSATATTSAEAVCAGICPRQSFAAVVFLAGDSTQKNRYGCVLKLEGAWRAAFRICSRSACGISTLSKALTALRRKTAVRMSFMIVMLLLQHITVADATWKPSTDREGWFCPDNGQLTSNRYSGVLYSSVVRVTVRPLALMSVPEWVSVLCFPQDSVNPWCFETGSDMKS